MLGGGPSGTALASALSGRGLSVTQVAPHPLRPFTPTYGAWQGELPHWAQACAAEVWTDVRVYTGPTPTPLLRPYLLFDNAALLRSLRAQGDWAWQQGTARAAERCGEGWRVRGQAGEVWRARLVVDATGHGGLFAPLRFPGGPALQTAYGIVARFRQPPIAPGSMVWMDYRTPAPLLRQGEATFLYAMHLGADRYFVEETSLIARPAPSRAELRARLLARLAAQGTPPGEVESEEWVSFPMNAAAPPQAGLLAYGAAAGRVHPVSGFQVTGALDDAPKVAEAVAQALAGGTDPAAAAWQALWPAPRREARELQLLGVTALLGLRREEVPQFFAAFFALPTAQWAAFLHPDTDAATSAATMLRLFAQAPARVRARLLAAALAHPAQSVGALGALARARR